LRLRLPTPGLVGSPLVHSSCLVPVSLASFLIKCLRVHWQSLPQCCFVWPLSRRVGYSSRGLLLPVFPLPLCQFLMSAAHLRCDTAIPRRLGHICPWGANLCIPHVFCSWVPPPNISLASPLCSQCSLSLLWLVLVICSARCLCPPPFDSAFRSRCCSRAFGHFFSLISVFRLLSCCPYPGVYKIYAPYHKRSL
jgi:hypothetical protein